MEVLVTFLRVLAKTVAFDHHWHCFPPTQNVEVGKGLIEVLPSPTICQ